MSYSSNPTDDFKTSTRAMLAVVRGEKARLKKRMQDLDEREAIILKWIEQEEGPQHELPMPAGHVVLRLRGKPSLSNFLQEAMQDGRPHTNLELAQLATLRGVVSENVDLRSINSTMLSLMNSGAVERRNDAWVLSKENRGAQGA